MLANQEFKHTRHACASNGGDIYEQLKAYTELTAGITQAQHDQYVADLEYFKQNAFVGVASTNYNYMVQITNWDNFEKEYNALQATFTDVKNGTDYSGNNPPIVGGEHIEYKNLYDNYNYGKSFPTDEAAEMYVLNYFFKNDVAISRAPALGPYANTYKPVKTTLSDNSIAETTCP